MTGQKPWVLLGCAVVVEVAASLALKGALDRPVLLVFVAAGYVSAFVVFARVLRAGLPVGRAYGVWAASGVLLTAALSTVVFDEPMSLLSAIGLGLVVLGVLLVEGGARSRRTSVPAVSGAGCL